MQLKTFAVLGLAVALQGCSEYGNRTLSDECLAVDEGLSGLDEEEALYFIRNSCTNALSGIYYLIVPVRSEDLGSVTLNVLDDTAIWHSYGRPILGYRFSDDGLEVFAFGAIDRSASARRTLPAQVWTHAVETIWVETASDWQVLRKAPGVVALDAPLPWQWEDEVAGSGASEASGQE